MLRQLRRKLRQIRLRVLWRIGSFGDLRPTGEGRIAEGETEQGALVGVREVTSEMVEREELVAEGPGKRAFVESDNGTDRCHRCNNNGESDNRQMQ